MLTLAVLLAAPAHAEPPAAGPTRTVTLPTGKSIDAKVVTPEAGSLEAQTVEAMKLVESGDLDGWIAKFCGPTLCEGPEAITSVKRLNLNTAQRTAAACHDGDNLVVTRVKGDRATDDAVTLYTWCGDGRMPAPVTWERVGEEWKIRSFSW
jgi:hypothetical protein